MVEISGGTSHQMKISQEVQNALKTDKAQKVIGEILADGKVDSKDSDNIIKLRTQLEEAASISSNDDDLELIDALDSTGGFLGVGATNKDIVQRNLSAINEKYKTMDPSELSFKDVKIETEGLFSTTTHSLDVQSEACQVEVNMEQLQTDLSTIGWQMPVLSPIAPEPITPMTPILPDLQTPQGTQEPLVTAETPASEPALTRKEIEVPGRDADSTRRLSAESLNLLKSLDLDGLKTQLNANRAEITAQFAQSSSAIYQGQALTQHAEADFERVLKAVADYQQNPSEDNLASLEVYLKKSELEVSSPQLNSALTDVRASIDIARTLNDDAKKIDEKISKNKTLSPLDSSSLIQEVNQGRTDLYQKTSSGVSKPGAVPLAAQDLRDLSAQVNQLKNSDSPADQAAYQELTKGFEDLPAMLESTAVELDAMTQSQRHPDAQMLLEMAQIRTQLDMLKNNTDKLGSEASPALQAVLDSLKKSAQSPGHLYDAFWAVKLNMSSEARLSAELQTAGNAIYTMLQPTTGKTTITDTATLTALTEQLRVIKQTQNALETGAPLALSAHDQKQLDPVLQSLFDASDHSIDLGYLTTLDFGFMNQPLFTPTDYFKPGATSANPLFADSVVTAAGPGGGLFGTASVALNPVKSAFGQRFSDLAQPPANDSEFALQMPGLLAEREPFVGMSTLPKVDLIGGVSSRSTQAALRSFSQPNLQETLLSNTQKSIKANRLENIEGLDDVQKASIQAALDSYAVDNQTKAHINNALKAQELVQQGKGASLVGGVPASELAKDLAFMHEVWSDVKNDKVKQAVQINFLIEALHKVPNADTLAREAVHAQAKASIKAVDAKGFDTKAYEVRTAATKGAINRVTEGNKPVQTQLDALAQDNPEFKQKLSAMLQTSFPGVTLPDVSSADELQAFFSVQFANQNPRELQQAMAGIIAMGTGDDQPFTQEQANDLRALFDSSITALESVKAARGIAVSSITDEINALTALKDSTTNPAEKAAYTEAIQTLSTMKGRLERGDIRQTDVNLFETVALIRRLSAETAGSPNRGAALAVIRDAWQKLADVQNNPSATVDASLDLTAIIAQFRTVLTDSSIIEATTSAQNDAAPVVGVFEAEQGLVTAKNGLIGNAIGVVITTLGGDASGIAQPATSPQTPVSPAADTPPHSSGGLLKGLLGNIKLNPGNLGAALELSRPLLNQVDLESTGDRRRENQEIEVQLAQVPSNSYEAQLLQERRDNNQIRDQEDADSRVAYEAMANQAQQAIDGGPAAQADYYRGLASAQNNIDDSMSRIHTALGLYTQEIDRSTNLLVANNLQIEKIQDQVQANTLAARASQLIQNANQLAEKLTLAPRSDASTAQSLSNLVREFLDTIQNQQFETQKIMMAVLAQQMLNQTITAFYKEQQDESQTYHEAALQQIADHFKQRMQSALETSLVSGSESGQAIAGLAGRVAQSEVSVGLSQAVQSSAQEFMNAARQAGLPITPVVEQLLLGAMDRIVQVGASVTPSGSQTDQDLTERQVA